MKSLGLLLLMPAASQRFNPHAPGAPCPWLPACTAWLVAGARLPLLWHLTRQFVPSLMGTTSPRRIFPGRGVRTPPWGGVEVRMGPGIAGEVGPQSWGTGRGGSLPWALPPKPASSPLLPGSGWGKILGLSPMEQGVIPTAGQARCPLRARPAPVGKEALSLSFGSDGDPWATGLVGDVLRR